MWYLKIDLVEVEEVVGRWKGEKGGDGKVSGCSVRIK
jgi:hypothetical protein